MWVKCRNSGTSAVKHETKDQRQYSLCFCHDIFNNSTVLLSTYSFPWSMVFKVSWTYWQLWRLSQFCLLDDSTVPWAHFNSACQLSAQYSCSCPTPSLGQIVLRSLGIPSSVCLPEPDPDLHMLPTLPVPHHDPARSSLVLGPACFSSRPALSSVTSSASAPMALETFSGK